MGGGWVCVCFFPFYCPHLWRGYRAKRFFARPGAHKELGRHKANLHNPPSGLVILRISVNASMGQLNWAEMIRKPCFSTRFPHSHLLSTPNTPRPHTFFLEIAFLRTSACSLWTLCALRYNHLLSNLSHSFDFEAIRIHSCPLRDRWNYPNLAADKVNTVPTNCYTKLMKPFSSLGTAVGANWTNRAGDCLWSLAQFIQNYLAWHRELFGSFILIRAFKQHSFHYL